MHTHSHTHTHHCTHPFPLPPLQRVLHHDEESALLKAYIVEWTKYFTQCDYLPKPFQAMEIEGGGSKPKRKSQEGNRVQLVRGRWFGVGYTIPISG